MNLLGTNRGGKHAEKVNHIKNKKHAENSAKNTREKKLHWSKKKKIIITVCSVLAATFFLIGATIAVVRWEVQPFYDYFFPRPDVHRLAGPRTPTPPTPDSPTPEVESTPVPNIDKEIADPEPIVEKTLEELRNMAQITFLIMGIDGDGNTDVIMVASFDIDEGKLEVVSIPRDTLMNVPWSLKKANFIQPMMRRNHGVRNETYPLAMSDTKDEFANFLGFNVDYWATVNMAGFMSLVNAIGGVRFNVPYSMNWEDPELNLNFNISRGEQVLTGQQALGVVRYREMSSDLGRIAVQQSFLKAAATQILAKRNSISITSLADIFVRHARTEVEVDNLVRIGRELMKLSGNDINFQTMPGTVIFNGQYVAVHVDEWLELINEKICPFYEDITPEDVSILTRDEDGQLYVTDDNWQASRDWRPGR